MMETKHVKLSPCTCTGYGDCAEARLVGDTYCKRSGKQEIEGIHFRYENHPKLAGRIIKIPIITCPICERELIPGISIDDHHLIPKTFRGKEKIILHKICHRKIHSVFTERELQHHYYTIERLREHEEIIKFVKWVSKKHPEFYDGSKETKQRKGR